MRLPETAHTMRPWRIHAILHDFNLKDVWALPVFGGAGDFQVLLDQLVSADPAHTRSPAVRLLWWVRDRLGVVLDLGAISSSVDEVGTTKGLPIPGTDEVSLAGRLEDDLRNTAADLRFESLPFEPLYRTDTEFAAEISNRTVHGVLHLGWVRREPNRFQGQLAIYVKERGFLGKTYMGLIAPFRYLIVYPALMRQVGREWERRMSVAGSERPGGTREVLTDE